MTTLVLVLLVSALVSYAAATAAFIAHLLSKRPVLATVGGRVLLVAVVMHAVGKGLRFAELGQVPATNSLEALNLLGLVVAAAFIYVAKRYGVPALGAFATPLAFVSLAGSLAFGDMTGSVPEALQSVWFPVHLAFAIGADALFAIAGVASAAFLVQERMLRKKKLGNAFRNLPPLHVLDEICHRLIAVGWVLMTMGMLAGAAFAKQEWGAYWSWDPRQTWSLLTWILFTAIMHARLTAGWQGRRAAYLTLIAVAFVLAALVGLDVFTETRHGGQYR
jgi:cytochrome c-type biogenesis protein CcsB